MVAWRENELQDVLKRRGGQFNGVLLFGNDDSAIASASRLVGSLMSGDEEPLRLDVSDLKQDPALLDDAFRAMSLLGDRRLVILSGVDEAHLAAVTPILASSVSGNFILFISGSLKKGSKLRTAAESAQKFGVVGFYEEVGAALVQRAQTIFRQLGLTYEAEVAERFVDLCGNDRSVLMGEAEKLALYVHPLRQVTLDDVVAVCGDQAAFESDALIAAVLDGDAERADRMFTSMLLSGDAKSVLIMLQMYLARLEGISAAMARGQDLASACRAARPPVFEKQQPAVARQLRVFSGDDLGRAQVSVQQAMLQSRQIGDLGEAITARCLLSLARMARQLRAKAAA